MTQQRQTMDLSLKTRHCDVCRKPRSIAQYAQGKTVCNQCRGGK